jgi:hypothetical protein
VYDLAIERYFSGVTLILHAGDIGGREVIKALERMAPVVAVSGNVDEYERSGFPRAAMIRRNGKTIAIRHVLYEKGKLEEDVQKWLERERPDVCVFGHSHRPTIEHCGPTLLFNPGSAGPKRFSLPRGIGLLTIGTGKVLPRLIRLGDKVRRSAERNSKNSAGERRTQ